MRIYSIFDSKAEAFMQPFFAATEGVALRYVTNAASEEGHEFNRHAEDYTLFEIGAFNESDGSIDPETPKAISNLVHLRQTFTLVPDSPEAVVNA